MANHKSAEKRIRSSKKRARQNKRILSALRKCEKQLRHDLSEKNIKAVSEGLKKLFRLSDRAKGAGVVKKNTANRKKSRFASKLAGLSVKTKASASA